MSKKYSLIGNLRRLWRFLMNKFTHKVDEVTDQGMMDELERLQEEAKGEIMSQSVSAEGLFTARKSFEAMMGKTAKQHSDISARIKARVSQLGSEEACMQDAELCRWMSFRNHLQRMVEEQKVGMEQILDSCRLANDSLSNARAAEQQIHMEIELVKHRINMIEITGASGPSYSPGTVRNRLEELRNRVSHKEFQMQARQEVATVISQASLPVDMANPTGPVDFSEFFKKPEEPKAEAALNG